MSPGWHFVATEAFALSVAVLLFAAYLNPQRNRVTRAIDGYWRWWLKRPLFGFGLFKSSRSVSLFQAVLILAIAAFLAVMFLTKAWSS